jgi:LMBR1 domain-containing protein 1
MDEDLEEEEEEGLLASTGRRFNATWQDITGRARKANPANYGTTNGEEAGRVENE